MPTEFANPYLACDQCGAWVTGASNLGDGEGPALNQPCGHNAGATSRCPSLSPVDGCACDEVLHPLEEPHHV